MRAALQERRCLVGRNNQQALCRSNDTIRRNALSLLRPTGA